MVNRISIMILSLLIAGNLIAQHELLQSGPMLGYSEMREAMIWVQTTEAAKVQISYWPQESPDDKHVTKYIHTIKDEGFTARLIADEVEPGITYDYEVAINDEPVSLRYPAHFQTQTLWQYRTAPPTFTMAVGSCSYINEPVYDRPGNSYGGDYHIFENIHADQPDAMLWLGDNTYLREVDWYSMTGIIERYTHSRSINELQPLLASTHHFAIWDDHDFGPNDSDRSFVHKDKTLQAFEWFWGNPTYGVNRQPGVTTFFQWGDVDFFLLDNRYFRRPNHRQSGEPTILGEEQLEWLIDALASSRAPFKMVAIGGQVLNTAEVYENYSNQAPVERSYLLSEIEKNGIKGVIFLTGDRHHTELSHYVNGAGNPVYDLTVSPLTSGHGSIREEVNNLRVDSTLVIERNYGLLTFSGPFRERQLDIQIMNKEGEELWNYTIKQ